MYQKLTYIISFIFVCCCAYSQPPENIFFRRLTQLDGLSKNSIWSTFRDREGFLWIATSKGLNCYDGSSVILYDEDKADGIPIPSNSIRFVTEDKTGKLWMCSETGLFVLDKKTNKFTTINLAVFKNKVSRISHLFYASDNHIYIGQGNNLLSIDCNTYKVKCITVESNPDLDKKYGIYQFCEDAEGNLWFSNYPYLYSYNIRKNAVRKFAVMPSKLNNAEPVEVGAIVCDGEDIWLGMYSSGGLAKFNKRNEQVEYFPVNNYLLSYAITAIAQDPDNKDYLWVGTKMLGLGLFNKKSNQFTRFYTRNDSRPGSLISNNISASINFDADQTCWTSTSDGISYFNLRTQALQTYYIEPYDGKNFNRYQYEYIVRDPLNPREVILSTKDNGIIRYDYARGRPVTVAKINTNDAGLRYKKTFIDWLQADKNGKIFFTSLEGLFVLNDDGHTEKLLNISRFKKTGFEKLQLYEAAFDDLNNLWLATSTGLWKYNISTRAFAEAEPNIPILNEDIYYITKGRSGELWIISNNHSLIRYDPMRHKYKKWTFSSDLSKKEELVPLRMVVDSGGNIWASSTRGLICLNPAENTFRIFKEKDGLCNSSLLQLAYDGNNLLYAGGDGCIAEINIASYSIRTFNNNEGLIDNSARGGLVIIDGELFIGGRNYIQVMKTDNRPFKKVAPLLITQLLANDERVTINTSTPAQLGYGQNSIQLDYRLLDLLDESNYTYQYRLTNYKNEWVNAGSINKALFFNLPAGKFTFEVRALNRKTGIVAAANSLSLVIATPWWQTWTFRILLVVFMLYILYYLYNIRIARLLAIEKTRQRIGKDLHDDIGTTLSSITLMNTVLKKKIISDPEEAMKLANKVEDTSRQMIQNMSDIVWSINPGNDTLEKLVNRLQQFMNDSFDENETDYALSVSPELFHRKISMELRKDTYLLCKEIISNAAKYSKATNFRLDLSCNNSFIVVDASDNGIGFKIDKQPTGNGLTNIQLRAEKHKGSASATSTHGVEWHIKLKI